MHLLTKLVLPLAAGMLLSTSLHADPFVAQNVRVGADYRIPFGGSVRAKAEAHSFGFHVAMERTQTPGADNADASVAFRTAPRYDRLFDLRFDAADAQLRSLYVGQVNVLVPVNRMGVDGSNEVASTQLSWPLVAAGFASFYVVAEDRLKKKNCTVSLTDDTPALGVSNCCATFTAGTSGLNACAF